MRTTQSIVAGAILVLVAAQVALWHTLRQRRAERLREESALVARQLARRIETQIAERLRLLDHLQRDCRIEGARAFLRRAPHGLLSLEWIDRDGKVAASVPRQPLLGSQLALHPVAGPVWREARRRRQPCATPPIELPGGRVVLALILPDIAQDGVAAWFDPAILLRQALERDRLELVVNEGRRELYRQGTPSVFAASQELLVLDRRWRLALAPTPAGKGAMAGGSDELLPALGLLLALLLFWSGRRLTAQRPAPEPPPRESLGELAGGIAHNFNNLLTGINAACCLAQRQFPPEAPAHRRLEDVLMISRRMAELTAQMLAYSGRSHITPERVDLSVLAAQMAGELRQALPAHVALVLECEPELPPVEADAALLRKVIESLVTNAREALGDAPGTIRLRTRALPGEVWLEVADDGCGMDHETLARAFEPFYSTKFTGRGLGLAAAQGIAQHHGGALEAHSEPGQGSLLRLRLPQAPRP